MDSVTNIAQGFPTIQAPLVNDDKTINDAWLRLLIALWNRTGMGQGVSSADAYGMAAFAQNPYAISSPDIDVDIAVSSLFAGQGPVVTGQGLESELFIPAAIQPVEDLSSALFFPVAPQNSGSGATAVTVFDEGTILTSALASLNFVGANISATAVGNAVTVTDNGMLPLCNGDLPGPGIMADGLGQCIGVVL